MGFILGFGSIETKVREDVKNALIGALIRKEDVGTVLKKWNDKADEYDKMPRETAPERYTKIWFYGGKLHFHHINRQHAFSPDGWALLQIEEDFGNEEAAQTTEEGAGAAPNNPILPLETAT
jgi:hypothetical protein